MWCSVVPYVQCPCSANGRLNNPSSHLLLHCLAQGVHGGFLRHWRRPTVAALLVEALWHREGAVVGGGLRIGEPARRLLRTAG